MDNKITKRRLSDFLSYEWILMTVIAVVAVILLELLYTMAGVRLTTGQQFKYFFDQSISGNASSVNRLLKDDKTFSYDVLKVSSEGLISSYNVLSVRLEIQDGDVLFTDCKDPAEGVANPEEVEDRTIRLKQVVDSFNVYSFEELELDAQTYLKKFIKDENLSDSDLFERVKPGVLDQEKISKIFRSRMKKDNRFRTQADIKKGIVSETARIERLYKEVVVFSKLLDMESTYEGLFYRYSKYAQRRDEQETLKGKEQAKQAVDGEKQRLNDLGLSGVLNSQTQDEEFVYALNLGKLPATTAQGKVPPSTICKLKNTDGAENVCLALFNFRKYQPHLQFETISFVNTIVRNCSTILDGVV